MARYKISNAHKKSVVELETWRNSTTGEEFTIEHGWRWGEWWFESDTEPEIDLLNEGDNFDPYSIGEIDNHNLDDGCWCFFEFPKDFNEALAEKIEQVWEEDMFQGLEELGFEHFDTDTIVSGPLTLEKVED